MMGTSTSLSKMVAAGPLSKVKKAIVAIGKLPEGSSLSDPQPYYDGTNVDFDVEATGFIHVHAPIEFAEGKSEPDPETGAVYYLAMIWGIMYESAEAPRDAVGTFL